MVVLENGGISEVKGISGWKTSKASATWSRTAVAAAGAGSVPEVMYLQLGDFKPEAGVAGLSVAVSPVDDAILVDGGKWAGTKGITDFKASFKAKNGTFSGSFNIYVKKEGSDKVVKKKVKVSGAVVDGVPYGTAVLSGSASWPLKLAGSCGGGC